MKIRIESTEAETAAAAAQLRKVFDVQEVSRFYANRGQSTLGRVYLTVAMPEVGGFALAPAAEQ